MPITEEQAKAYKIVGNILGKLLFTIAIIIVFVASFIFIIISSDTVTKITLGTLDTFLSFTVYKAINHYFPSKK